MAKIDPPYPLISRKLFAGQVIPFLGSGASLQSSCGVWEKCDEKKCYYLPKDKCLGLGGPPKTDECIPKAGELACYLARQTRFPAGETLELTKVAQYYEAVAGGRTQLNSDLSEIFNKDYQFNSLHELLAEVTAPLLIMTTNYDDLIEQAFIKKGREYDLVVYDAAEDSSDFMLHWPYGETVPRKVLSKDFDIDLDKTNVIYKMHGTVNRLDIAQDKYVITEDDYIDFLTRMTKSSVIPAQFQALYPPRPFLFLGYSLSDWNLRVLLNRIKLDKDEKEDLLSWAIQVNSSEIEKMFWSKRRVQVYDVPLHEFVTEIWNSKPS